MKNTISGREEKTYMKLIVDKPTDSVVGVHMMGDWEIMQGIAIAVKMGATKADFDATIGIHPLRRKNLLPCAVREETLRFTCLPLVAGSQ